MALAAVVLAAVSASEVVPLFSVIRVAVDSFTSEAGDFLLFLLESSPALAALPLLFPEGLEARTAAAVAAAASFASFLRRSFSGSFSFPLPLKPNTIFNFSIQFYAERTKRGERSAKIESKGAI